MEAGNTGGRRYFLYDGTEPVVELDGAGNVTAVNTFGASGLLSRRSGSTSLFYTFDPQGSVTQRLDASENVLTSDVYDAFGGATSSGTPTDPFGYGAQWGYYADRESGLLLLTWRYYDAGTGRFLNRDPIGVAGGLNVYSYAAKNPISNGDPTGLIISVIGNASFVTAVNNQINTIANQGPQGAALIAALRASPFLTTIQFGPGYSTTQITSPDDARPKSGGPWWNPHPVRGKGSGATVTYSPWGPPFSTDLIRTCDNKPTPRVLGLAHELIHAWRAGRGITGLGEEELQTNSSTNLLYHEFGLGGRTSYYNPGDVPPAPKLGVPFR